jgi:pimeloyl-ACP methyl ester carboxylesterase
VNNFRALALLVAMVLSVPAFAATPVPDPAIDFANAHRVGAIGYKQGWYGKGETRLHYVEAGEGPLVILYHGFPSYWFSWFDLMETLKTRYRVVAVDGLGAGLSGKPESLEPYRIDRLSRQLDGLARQLNGNRRFILIGHDWGAALSLAYAQAYPKRLHAVVGMSAPPYNLFLELVRDDPEQRVRSTYMQQFRKTTLIDLRKSGFAPRFARQVYGGLRDKGELSVEEAALFEAAVGQPETIAGGINWYRANIPDFSSVQRALQWPKRNRPIDVPVLIVWGEQDNTFVPRFLDQMPRFAPKLSVIRLPATGHMTSIENAERSSKEIAGFLHRVCAKAETGSC